LEACRGDPEAVSAIMRNPDAGITPITRNGFKVQ